MKILSVVAPILVFCSFGSISARTLQVAKINADNWLGLSVEKIASQCKMKNKDDMLNQLFTEYVSKEIKFMKPIDEQGIEESDFTWHYIYNTDMIIAMKNLIKGVQDCLDEENRLDSEGIVTVMDRVLKAHARKITKIDPLNEIDYNCLRSQEAGESICDVVYPSSSKNDKRKLFDILVLQIIENSSCEQTLPYEKCIMKELRNCSSKAKNVMKVMMSPAEVGVCNNFLQETDREIEEINDQVISEGINDIFNPGEVKSVPFKKLLRYD